MNGRTAKSAKRLRHASACSLLFLLSAIAGCHHREPPVIAPVAVAPPITPSSITVITPLPSVPPQATADVKPALPPAPAPAPTPTPVKQKRHIRHKQPATNVAAVGVPASAGTGSTANHAVANPPDTIGGSTAASNPASEAPAQPGTAATTPSSEAPASTAAAGTQAAKVTASTEAAPALGELSTGTSISSTERTRMLREIQIQETRLSKQKAPATADAHTLLMQVQTFLQKAAQAVAENDLDGAQTLTTKARVLLDELQSE